MNQVAQEKKSGILGGLERLFSKYILGFFAILIVYSFTIVVDLVKFSYKKALNLNVNKLRGNFLLIITLLFGLGFGLAFLKDYITNAISLNEYIKFALFVSYKIVYVLYAVFIVLFFLVVFSFLADVLRKYLTKANFLQLKKEFFVNANALGLFLQRNFIYIISGIIVSYILLIGLKTFANEVFRSYGSSGYLQNVILLVDDILYVLNSVFSLGLLVFIIWAFFYYRTWNFAFKYFNTFKGIVVARFDAFRLKPNSWNFIFATFIITSLLFVIVILLATFGVFNFYGDNLIHLSLLAISIAVIPILYFKVLKK